MGDVLVGTPLSLTNPCVVHAITLLRNPKRNFFEKEVVTRLLAFVATSFFQALDLVLNLACAAGKIILSMMKEVKVLRDFFHLNHEEISFEAVGHHLIKVGRCFAGVISGSLGGLVKPTYLFHLCPLAQEVSWKWEKEPTSLKCLFDHGYYLNLEKRADRKVNLENHLKEIDINQHVERFNALDGRNPEVMVKALSKLGLVSIPQNQPVDYVKIHEDFLKKIEEDKSGQKYGRLACYLGHVFMYMKALQDRSPMGKVPNALILEDDCRIKKMKKGPKDLDEIHNIHKNLPEDWDIMFLGGRHDVTAQELEDNCYIEKINQSVLLHCYIINGKDDGRVYHYLIDYLLEGLRNATVAEKMKPIDNLIGYIQGREGNSPTENPLFKPDPTMPPWVAQWRKNHPTLNCYSPAGRWLAGQVPGFSDIEGGEVPSSKDK